MGTGTKTYVWVEIYTSEPVKEGQYYWDMGVREVKCLLLERYTNGFLVKNLETGETFMAKKSNITSIKTVSERNE